jgi:tRNA(Ile)-lysidine synthase
VHFLAERVLIHMRREELLRAGDWVGVAVSGGIDSVALLRLLIELRRELGLVVSVVHFNHKLRGAESDADLEFVAGLAREHELEFYWESDDVAQLAAEKHCGLEGAARELRYGFFRRLLGNKGSKMAEPAVPQGLKPESLMELIGAAEAAPLQGSPLAISSRAPLNKVATAHNLDDQAETVLMRVIRGTGTRGLGGIYPRFVVEDEDGEGHGEIIRPLLQIRRRELERYLQDLKQPWREDSTNADSKFTRNRMRNLVLPLLEREFNPAVAENLSELAEIARDEEAYWENEISGWLGTVVQWSQPEWARGLPGFGSSEALVQIQSAQPNSPELWERLGEAGWAVMNASVSRPWLVTEPRAVQRRVLKAIGRQAGIPLEFKHVEEILRFAAEDGPSGKELALPLGWKLVREPESMIFLTPDLRRQPRVPDYEYLLAAPGKVLVAELGVVIEALRVGPEREIAEYNPHQLVHSGLCGPLTVRNWRPGDRFWPAHTKSPKKVKELLQEKHVAQPERRLWPVIVSGDEIVWMRGFPVPTNWRAKSEQEAILIREMPLAADE